MACLVKQWNTSAFDVRSYKLIYKNRAGSFKLKQSCKTDYSPFPLWYNSTWVIKKVVVTILKNKIFYSHGRINFIYSISFFDFWLLLRTKFEKCLRIPYIRSTNWSRDLTISTFIFVYDVLNYVPKAYQM